MSVLVTLAAIAVAAGWFLAVYRRLIQLREQVKLAWQKLEADPSNDAIKTVYNRHVSSYNSALEAFPAYLVAPLTGLKHARHYS